MNTFNARVNDAIVPVLSVPYHNENQFSFRGTGFYISESGFFITCKHVVDDIPSTDYPVCHQIMRNRQLKLNVVRVSSKYDLVLCKSEPPDLVDPWPIIDEPYVTLGTDVEMYGFIHEPMGTDNLPFRQRYMKGYVAGVSREQYFPNSYELSFPVLFGMSGAPVMMHSRFSDGSHCTGIVGFAYGSRESSVVKHSRVTEPDHSETVSRVVELGIAYSPAVLNDLLDGTEIVMPYLGRMNG